MSFLYVAGGRILGASGSTVCTPSASQATAPWVSIAANGGDQSYGQATTGGFTAYSAAAPGTDAYIATQLLGSYDIVFALAGGFEGWGTSSSGRTKQDLVATVKGQGTYPNVKNANRTPYVFLYWIMESSQNIASGAPYQTYLDIARAKNWWTYETSDHTGTGTITPSAFGTGFFEINYSHAYPTSAGAASIGSPICGNVYGTLSNSQGPAETGAQYIGSALLTSNRLDNRFTALPLRGAAPNADGIFLDNVVCYPNGVGTMVTSSSWDGIGTQTNSTVAVYPTGASSLLAAGQAKFFSTLQSYLASCNPGSKYLNCGNFGSYANNVGLGNTHSATSNIMDQVLHAGVLEAVGGVSGFGWQSFMTFSSILTNIDYGLGYLQPPGLLGIQVRVPATDGSSTAYLVTGGTGQTVNTGTALEYQSLRCFLAMSHMRNTYLCVGTNGFNYGTVRWYDEFGDDSLAQVNVKRGYLGTPTGPYVTLSNGVHVRPFTGGCVLFNEWGNGAQTVTSAQLTTAIGGTYKRLNGTQQPTINNGAAFSSYAMLDADGLILVNG